MRNPWSRGKDHPMAVTRSSIRGPCRVPVWLKAPQEVPYTLRRPNRLPPSRLGASRAEPARPVELADPPSPDGRQHT